MVVIIAAIIVLVAFAVNALHRVVRGGRWSYVPLTRRGWIVLGLNQLSPLIVIVLMVAGIIGTNVFMSVMATNILVDFAYASWRREREYRGVAKVA